MNDEESRRTEGDSSEGAARAQDGIGLEPSADADFEVGSVLNLEVPSALTRAACAFLSDFVMTDRVYLLQVQALIHLKTSLHVALEFAENPLGSQMREFSQGRVREAELVFNRVSRIRDVHDARNVVDNFLTYLCELAVEILHASPQSLRSSATVTLDEVLRHESLEDFVATEAVRRVRKASQAGFFEIRKLFEDTLKLLIATKPEDSAALDRAIKLRNLITHQRGIVDPNFLSNWQTVGGSIDGLVSGEPVPRQLCLTSFDKRLIVRMVFDLDRQAAKKFGLPSMDYRECVPTYRLDEDAWLESDETCHDPLCPCAVEPGQVKSAGVSE